MSFLTERKYYLWRLSPSASRQFEAIQLTAKNVDSVSFWCGGMKVEEIDPLDPEKKFAALNVETLTGENGVSRASEGDYVIRTPEGSFFVMSEYQFNQYYVERTGK